MARTFIRLTQVSGSSNFSYLDSSSRETLDTNPGDLLQEINSIRSTIKDLSGESDYYAGPSEKSIKNIGAELREFISGSAKIFGPLEVNGESIFNNSAILNNGLTVIGTGSFSDDILAVDGSFSGHLTASSLILSDPITLSAQATSKTYVDNSVADVTPLSGASSRIYYVSKGGNNTTADGSIAKQFLTIQAAHDQALVDFPLNGASTEQITINVGPGTYTEDLTVSRQRTLFVCDDRDIRHKTSTIEGTISIDCSTASSLLGDSVLFDGFNISPVENESEPSVKITGTGAFSVIINNSDVTSLYGTNSAILCDNTSSPIIRMRNTLVNGNKNAHTIDLQRGTLILNQSAVVSNAYPSAGSVAAVLASNNATVNCGINTTILTQNPYPAVELSGTASGYKFQSNYSTVSNTANSSIASAIRFISTNLSSSLDHSFFSINNSSAFIISNSVGTSRNFTGNNTYAGTFSDAFGGGATNSLLSGEYVTSTDVFGRLPSLTVRGIQGRSVSSTTPSVNQGLVWSGSDWRPTSVALLSANNIFIGTSNVFSGSTTFGDNAADTNTFNGTSIFNSTITSNGPLLAYGNNTFGNSISDSHKFTGSVEFANGLTGSLLGTASYALDSDKLDGYHANEFALLNSANIFTTDQVINGNLTVNGTASVNFLITTYESSSIIYSSGSTKFGDTSDDTHEFTGTILLDGDSKLGDNSNNTHQFTGSVYLDNNLSVNGNSNFIQVDATNINVSNDLNVTHNTIFGVNEFSTHQFTGSVYLDNNLSVNGNLRLGNLSGTASHHITGNIYVYNDLNIDNGVLNVNADLYAGGTSRFGSEEYHTHQFTGSVLISGSLSAGNVLINDPISLDKHAITKEYVEDYFLGGISSNIHFVQDGGKFATLQAAIDIADSGDVILVGPKTSSWGNIVLPAEKRLTIHAVNGSREQKNVSIGSVTYAPTTGLNINNNEVILSGFLINYSAGSGDQVVNFGGTAPARLRLTNCYVYKGSGVGDGVLVNNSGSGSSLYLNNCIVQASVATGIGLKHQLGYTNLINRTDFSGWQYNVTCAAGNVSVDNCTFAGSTANEVIRISGGSVTMGYSYITNTTAGASGVNLTTAGAVLSVGETTFAIATTGGGYVVNGVAGTYYLFANVGYASSALAAYNTSINSNVTAVPAARTGGTFTTELSMSSKKITSLANPTANQDAATKFYVDSLVSGVSNSRNKETQILTSSVSELALVSSLPSDINKNLNVYVNGVLLNVSGSYASKNLVAAAGLDAAQKNSENSVVFAFDLQINDVVIFEKF
jgi:hypothetical protein